MKRVDQLQAELDRARKEEDRDMVNQVCRAAGIGLADVLSKSRTQRIAKARAAVAWSLHRKLGWRQKRVAEALGVSLRAIKKMTISSPSEGN